MPMGYNRIVSWMTAVVYSRLLRMPGLSRSLVIVASRSLPKMRSCSSRSFSRISGWDCSRSQMYYFVAVCQPSRNLALLVKVTRKEIHTVVVSLVVP